MENPPARRYDWDALMAEWLQGNETLNQFRLRHELHQAHFYKKADEMGWEERRSKLRARAVQKAESKAVARLAGQYGFQVRQWKTVEGIVARVLKGIAAAKVEGEVDLEKLDALTRQLERALKCQKLIAGEWVGEGGEVVPAGTMSHAQVVGLIKAIENQDPRFMLPGTPPIEAEVVEDTEETP